MPRSRQPPERPVFFIDRSLGRHLIPDALFEAGFEVHTMLSVYGIGIEETVADEIWLERVGTEGWVALTKDKRIRHRINELIAVQAHAVRLFYLVAGGLTGPQQRDRLLKNVHRIAQHSRKRGPWMRAIYEDRVDQVWPR